MKILILSAVLTLISSIASARNIVVYTALEKIDPDAYTANSEIYVMDVASKKPQRVTDHPAMDFEPALHPNKKMIAFVTDRYKYDYWGDLQIVLKSLVTGEEEHIQTGRNFWHHKPKFSRDGRYLYFSRAEGPGLNKPMTPYQMARYDLKTKAFEILYSHAEGSFFDLAPSPDGKSIAYRYAGYGQQHVRVMNLATGESRELNSHREGWELNPSWRSPDKVTILGDYGDRPELAKAMFEVSLSGNQATQILKSPLLHDFERVCWFTPTHGVAGAVDAKTFNYELFEIKGSKIQKITNDTKVWWSNDPDC